MKIESILKKLKSAGVEHVVYTAEVVEPLLTNTFDNDGLHYIQDVRSAVFTAYGISKMSHVPVVVLLDESYLPSTYTGLTEAWFQRVPVIVISYNGKSLDKSFYLDRCVDLSIVVSEETIIDAEIRKIVSLHGPSLIKVQETIKEETPFDYTEIVSTIIDGDARIFCYNAINVDNKIVNIDYAHKYGVLSKYVGYLSSGKDSILVIPEEILSLDSNIFNFRNFPQNFKLIVKADDTQNWEKFTNWMTANGIRVEKMNIPIEKEKLQKALKETPVAILLK